VPGLKGVPQFLHTFKGGNVEVVAGAPHTPQNLAPGLNGVLHLGQALEDETAAAPQ
jgi:hypothetical protein